MRREVSDDLVEPVPETEIEKQYVECTESVESPTVPPPFSLFPQLSSNTIV